MAYLVFARKYRPLSFADVVGQQHVTDTLRRAIERDRVAHAYIFTGTRGVGKTTTARILARALNCDKGPTPAPCGECDSCRQIIAGSSLDVLEIDGASNRGVDDVRQLRENIAYTSMSGRYRVIVIDEVHMLTREAFNALLKTLEEPPPRVVFIFATTEPHRIPATIHSRCQRHDFRRISTEQIQQRLEFICTSEQVDFDPEALLLVARKADGSMRDALSLLDQVYSYCEGRMELDKVRTVLGVVGADAYAAIMRAVVDKKQEPVLEVVRDILIRGYDLREFVVGLEEYLRDMIFSLLPGLGGAERSALRQTAGLFGEHTLLRMADAVRRCEQELQYSAFPRFVVEALLLKLVHMDDTVSLERLLSLVDSAQSPSAEADPKKKDLRSERPAPPPRTLPPAPSGTPSPQPEPEVEVEPEGRPIATFEDTPERPARDLRSHWKEFLEQLHAERPSLSSHLAHAQIAAYTGTSLDLRLASNLRFSFDQLTRPENRAYLEKRVAQFAEAPVQVHLTLETAAAGTEEAHLEGHVRGPASASLADDIQSEPIIQTVLDVFDGEVIE